MADFGGATDLEAFRKEVREWVEANFPASLKGKPNPMMREERTSPTPDMEAWRKAVGEKGWGTPTWPKAYGGGGLSGAEARVIQGEFGRAGAYNPIGGMGVMMFGPTLLEYGTEAQKQEHIPPICRGEIAWCQGFSEPGAGSDLAALSTKAEDKGDHFEINGSKIWTSGAHGHVEEARGHQLRPLHDAPAGRRGSADPADRRLVALLRDLLHQCPRREKGPGGSPERRLDHRQAAAAA
jgi:alkylation response protein AidB-like acyl-CoA dehydrogenase